MSYQYYISEVARNNADCNLKNIDVYNKALVCNNNISILHLFSNVIIIILSFFIKISFRCHVNIVSGIGSTTIKLCIERRFGCFVRPPTSTMDKQSNFSHATSSPRLQVIVRSVLRHRDTQQSLRRRLPSTTCLFSSRVGTTKTTNRYDM